MIFGSNGGGETYTLDYRSQPPAVVLVPSIGFDYNQRYQWPKVLRSFWIGFKIQGTAMTESEAYFIAHLIDGLGPVKVARLKERFGSLTRRSRRAGRICAASRNR